MQALASSWEQTNGMKSEINTLSGVDNKELESRLTS